MNASFAHSEVPAPLTPGMETGSTSIVSASRVPVLMAIGEYSFTRESGLSLSNILAFMR